VSTWWQRFLALHNVYVEEPEPEVTPVERKPRGAVVTRTVLNPEREFTQALDEFPWADYWLIRFTSDAKDGTLSLYDVIGQGVATYKPGTWDRVESGTAENIKTKVEEPNKP
jgi:hypothetical protein